MKDSLFFITDGSLQMHTLQESITAELTGVCTVQALHMNDISRSNIPDAIILPYKREYAYSESFRTVAELIAERFGSAGAEDLRTYIFPVDLTQREFLSVLDNGSDSALADLGDVIQITAGTDLRNLADDIRLYFSTREKARRVRKREALRHRIEYLIGCLATIVTAACLIYSFPRFFADMADWKIFEPLRSFYSMIPYDAEITCLIWFVGWIMILSALISIFQKGFSGAKNERERLVCYPMDELLAVIILFSAVSSAYHFGMITDFLKGRWYLPVAGVFIGVILDVLRRMRSKGNRYLRFKALDKAMSTGTDAIKLSSKLRDSGRRPITNALRKAYFHKGKTKIFVSYTHSSAWARQRVDELVELCRQSDIDCFVDKEGIPRGASWRRSIFSGLLRADYFIAFADQISVEKQWPAAELEMALAMRSISGGPYPIVFVPEDFPHRVTDDYLPVFRDTMLCSSEPDFFVRVIWYSALSLKTLITKAIAKKEAKAPNSLFVGSYKGKSEDKKKAKEADKACFLMKRARSGLTVKHLNGKTVYDLPLEKRYHLIRSCDADERSMLGEFANNADYAIAQLMPKQAYYFLQEAVELAVIMGRSDMMIEYGKKMIQILYGSLWTDYMGYLEIHRYEYIIAFAYEKQNDAQNAALYASRCLRGLESIETLRDYFFSGFRLHGKSGYFQHGVTVLPLSFKFLSSSGFPDIRPPAQKLLERNQNRCHNDSGFSDILSRLQKQ